MKCIGIVGGAGPLAGAFLLEKIFSISNKMYGCYKDNDYPKVILISFPFSDMLSPDVDSRKIQQELSECLEQLRRGGATILAIACNTLHAFLDPNERVDDLVHLLHVLTKIVDDYPRILCTSTSVKFGLHKRFFPCSYPDKETQEMVDELIDQVLRGEEEISIIRRFEQLIQSQEFNTVVLGCTELSIFADKLDVPNKKILDPLNLLAHELVKAIFTVDLNKQKNVIF